jgi:hypothetical protein
MSTRRDWLTIYLFQRWALTVLLALVLLGCADAGDRSREIARVRAHLEGAERALRASTPLGLNAFQAENRAVVIQNLHRYILAEEYPTNRISEEMTPIFVDEDGARCALAALVEASGHHALVERIARSENLAYVEELKDDPELQAWLLDSGITLLEAARIQPAYSNTTETRWQPTVSVFGSVQGGTEPGVGAHVALSPGLRVGGRRITETGDACDRCVYTSMALVAEYSRSFILGAGSTNHIGLLVQLDLSDQAYDHTFYVSGGPLASIDENAEPGFGLGGQAGFGFNFRRRSYPLFGELICSALGQAEGPALRGGFNLGVVW